MADEGTLATTAQVLLAIGKDATTNQISEVNTNIWILMAEADMSIEANRDIKANILDVPENYKQFLASMASNRAAFYAINNNQNAWQLATTQSKLNVIDAIWKAGLTVLRDKDKIATLGL